MPVKAAYSLKPETVKMIDRISDQTYRSKSAVIDMAVALLGAQVFSEDGGVDLPPTPPSRKTSRTTRKTTKQLNPIAIPGVQRGLKKLSLEAA